MSMSLSSWLIWLLALPPLAVILAPWRPGELDRILTPEWRSDQDHAVMEVPDENNAKVFNDSERCTLHDLLRQLASAGLTEVTLNNHDVSDPIAELGVVMQ